MQIIKILIATAFSLAPIIVFAGGNLVYHGLACQNQYDPHDTTPSSIPLTSNIYFSPDNTPNVYNVRITGGIPRMQLDVPPKSPESCIDGFESLGMKGMAMASGVFGDEPPTYLEKKTEVYGQAYASGNLVIININSLLSDEKGRTDPSSGMVLSSSIRSISHTLIFRYDNERNLFILDHIRKGVGVIVVTGNTHLNTYLEAILPQDVNTVDTKSLPFSSSVEIAYRIEE